MSIESTQTPEPSPNCTPNNSVINTDTSNSLITINFNAILLGYDLLGYIDGTHSCPPKPATTSPTSPHALWVRQDQLSLHAIFAFVFEQVISLIATATTSKVSWDKLNQLYAIKARSRVMGLKEHISLMRHDSKLAVIDVPIFDDDLVIHILNGQILLSNLDLSIEDLATTNQINPAPAITLVLAILVISQMPIHLAATFLTAATLDMNTGAVLLQGLNKDDVYEWPRSVRPIGMMGVATPQSAWHQRLGHPHHRIVLQIIQSSSKFPVESSCVSCQCNKSHRLSFGVSSLQSRGPLDILYNDVWGPAPCSSVDALVENYFKTKIIALYSDGGGEFVKLKNFLVTHGITHLTTPPHTPQHNAAYLINLLPTPTLQNIFPYTALFGQNPNYQKLHIFGCVCYPWLCPYNSHKLLPGSRPCIFLGYSISRSAYQCLDLSTNRLFLSRHVQFDESTFPFATHEPTASRVSSSSLSTWTTFLPSLVSIPLRHATTPHPPSPPPINLPPSQGPQPLPSLTSEEIHSPAPFSPSGTPSGIPSSLFGPNPSHLFILPTPPHISRTASPTFPFTTSYYCSQSSSHGYPL
ncbi:unnamed protein product [Prunus armeniaca]|uniref:Retroviral polymerase SH3-like domain-containing protein n=1 Tax=Prunus armeniaca TaxID=36596 RepID=A0A6J5XZ28_PRUAR|nr:unnamed protein product [Prunus armeniaca]